ncbi:MAG: 16S rRNA (guanine(527)-N(7))-methyltransferase RsmG [Treponema sp.]|nr:16S rRNA (guanine(527)-N(7))-methyltransferase RsmG [Treponema sp.]
MCILYRYIEKEFHAETQRRREEIISLLEQYINEIEMFNSVYGLVSVTNTEELVIKHILDSLAPLEIISNLINKNLTTEYTEFHGGNNAFESKTPCSSVSSVVPNSLHRIQIADAGSGAGLPGIPLAITLPDCDFTLIERMGRRAGFLLNTKAVLNLSNVIIEEKELEKIEANQFDIVTFRAFKPIEPKLLKTLFKICKPNGIIAAYKGKKEKINAEMTGLDIEWQTIPYKVPFLDEERNLLIIKTGT